MKSTVVFTHLRTISQLATVRAIRNKTPMQPVAKAKVRNHIWEIMQHTTRYAFNGQAQLSRDAGVSNSAICRLISGKSNPSFVTVERITQALEKQIGKYLDLRDVVTAESYPKRSVCQLIGCRGCTLD